MEEFTIYYGTPEGKDKKIGVDCSYPARIKKQKIMDGQILEVHTCVYEVSDREMELQRQYGVKVDTIPYYVTYFKNKKPSQRTKISETLQGFQHTEETKTQMSASHSGLVLSEETKAKISESHMGIMHTEETKERIRNKKLGTKASPETKAKMSATRNGKKLVEATCKHCGKTGQKAGMTRYHFDNCKHKKHE
jgi:hypothetical protein